MSMLLDDLRPKMVAQSRTLQMYDSDFETFKSFLDFLNKKRINGNGSYTEEDLFSKLIENIKEIKEFQEHLNGGVRKRRRRKNENKNDELFSI